MPKKSGFYWAGESNVSHLSLSFIIEPHRPRWSVVKVNLGAGCFWVTSPRVTVVSAVPRKKFAKRRRARRIEPFRALVLHKMLAATAENAKPESPLTARARNSTITIAPAVIGPKPLPI
jgi:hypothetical protein